MIILFYFVRICLLKNYSLFLIEYNETKDSVADIFFDLAYLL